VLQVNEAFAHVKDAEAANLRPPIVGLLVAPVDPRLPRSIQGKGRRIFVEHLYVVWCGR
jgi:hypothetical protein